MSDRSRFLTSDTVRHLCAGLKLPEETSKAASLPDADSLALPSSFKLGQLAQASITLAALTAALIYAERTKCNAIPRVMVPLRHAALEFRSERLLTLDGKPMPSVWGPLSGLHKTSDGYVRVHDNFPNHRAAVKKALGLSDDADRDAVSAAIATWRAVELEDAAVPAGAVVAALRSFDEWDALPHAREVADFPIQITKIDDSPPRAETGGDWTTKDLKKSLGGIKVLEMSRVIAAPVAGRTLAAHGADVLWITSPNLPDLPSIDIDTARGKRTAQLDITQPEDLDVLLHLLDDADVFLQSYRPSSIAARGLSAAQLVKRRNKNATRSSGRGTRGIVCANLSAYGPSGPWKGRRGFDSLVQTCSGMNVSEALHFGQVDPPAKPTPCQALDHAAGYFLAAGIMAALYRQGKEGGSWQVDVSLAGTMKYLRSLGQLEGRSGFLPFERQAAGVPDEDGGSEMTFEKRMSAFGLLNAVKHSASVEGVEVGWDIMPKPLGSDAPKWL